jgi:hypothetical protein
MLLMALCACSAGQPGSSVSGSSTPSSEPGVSETASNELEDLNRQISSLEAQIVVLEEQLAQTQGGEEGVDEGEGQTDFVDLGSLLSQIKDSGKVLNSFPALVTGVEISEAGCTLSFEKLETNQNYTAGGESGGDYLLNPEAVTEQINGQFSYAQYNGRVTDSITQDFANYIAGFDGGAEFTFYILGDELVLVSEITVP